MAVAEFLPIILIFLFLSQTKEFVQFSRTIPGKLVAVGLIIYYTSIDKYLGLFVCAVTVFFFQNDQIENMTDYEPMEDSNINEITAQTLTISVDEPTPVAVFDPVADSNEILDDYVYLEGPTRTPKNKPTNIITLSPLEQFRQDNCVKNELMYKNMNVKNDMIQHIYPEIEFKGKVCNPCLPSCEVTVPHSLEQ